jgi:hypothetical protein
MRSGAGRANNSGRFNDGLGTTYGRGLLAASGTVLGPYFEKDLGISVPGGKIGAGYDPLSSVWHRFSAVSPGR